jgi:XTP/dITP diphosphohydrolase
MKKSITFVTTNKGKIASAHQYLKNTTIHSLSAELIEPRTDDVREIAKAKVLQAYEIAKEPCIALDAGFFVDELNGFPRAYVNPMLETIGIEGMIKLMKGVENRNCHFLSCLAYYDGTEVRIFESKSPGFISEAIRGRSKEIKWSDLWYIFIPEGYDKTLAEFTTEEHEYYSDDKNRQEPFCFRKFGEWFEQD